MNTKEKIQELLGQETSEHGAPLIAFFGDSVTQGYFEYGNPFDDKACFPTQTMALLRSKFPNKTLNFINAGIGGDDTVRALKRIDRDVLRHAPDICIVAFGVNDVWNLTPVMFEENMRTIIEALEKQGILVVLMTEHHANKKVLSDVHPELVEVAEKMAVLQNAGKNEALFEVTRKLAKEYDLPLADLYAYYSDLEKQGVDTDTLLANRINHPTREMHRIFAEKIVEAMGCAN